MGDAAEADAGAAGAAAKDSGTAERERVRAENVAEQSRGTGEMSEGSAGSSLLTVMVKRRTPKPSVADQRQRELRHRALRVRFCRLLARQTSCRIPNAQMVSSQEIRALIAQT
eukprot:1430517-Rhodomonas_salina.1